MSKNIVICFDGTWGEPDKPDASVSRETNVRSLYEVCVNDRTQGQIAYYDEGVGTHFYDKFIGALSGLGLSKNIKEAYTYLIEHYEAGDKVFLFGFSRGAYTARSLSGLLFRCGLLPKSQNSFFSYLNIFGVLSKFYNPRVAKLYNAYKDRDQDQVKVYKLSNRYCPVAMLGVWDTVGALGIPVSFLKEPTDKIFNFHDTKLSPEVEFACHAIAIDEQRESFEPTLWEETAENKAKIKQVWFAGVHSDVGGGGKERYHSDVAFEWMLDQAKERGLKIKENHNYSFQSDLSQKIQDSFWPFGKRPREAIIARGNIPKVHWSVREKLQLLPDYQPLALKNHIRDWATLSPYEIEEKRVIYRGMRHGEA